MKKLLISLISSTLLITSLNIPLTNALSIPILGDLERATIFNDVTESTPNNDAIKTLKGDKIISGYEDGTFKPNNTINRAEFMTIIMNSISNNIKGSNCFSDVNNEWFAPAICSAKELGLVDGYDDGTFKAGQNINLAEASKIITNANKLEKGSGSTWFEPFILALENKNAIPVSIDSLNKKLSRGEVAEMIYRITNNKTDKSSKTLKVLKEEIPQITSCKELEEKIATNQYRDNYYFDDIGDIEGGMLMPTVAKDVQSNAPFGTGMEGAKLSRNESSSDYSSTNIQVQNVDESDTVKNNGSHIFFIQDQKIKVIKAFPANEMEEVTTIIPSAKVYPKSIYLSGNTLIVLSSIYTNRNQTEIDIYDISNPSLPKQKRTLKIDGNEISSRRIGDNLYLVLNQYQPYFHYSYYKRFNSNNITNLEENLPSYYDSLTGETEKLAGCDDIMYFPGHRSVNYLTVVGIPLNQSTKSINRTVILGASENVYASTENLYVTTTDYRYNDFEIYDTWDTTSSSRTNTIIHQFKLDNGNVTFKDKGEVEGRILNQFSMDEHNESFRIATTTDSSPNMNALYILNKNNLKETQGSIKNIAPGEQIYSTRFMGDRTYMVTFKNTDPFFVIDTKDPYNPKILGKLKLPGYSNYLHPYDENHIIGLGKDAVENKDGDFAWYQGMKLGLFDVSNVNNPKEVASVTIGDRGTESEALRNHKAILFSKEKGFIAFPITIAEIDDQYEKTQGTYGEYVFQGAQVYNINANNISLRGSITHHDDSDVYLKGGSYWWGGADDISRILYIGNNFYTISKNEVRATNMESMKKTNSVNIEYEGAEDGIIPII